MCLRGQLDRELNPGGACLCLGTCNPPINVAEPLQLSEQAELTSERAVAAQAERPPVRVAALISEIWHYRGQNGKLLALFVGPNTISTIIIDAGGE